MQLSFKEHFQLILFQKLWDWRLEKFCIKNHAYLLDHHQRSHYDTITIGPEGNDELGSTVEQQPVGKLVQQSCGEVQHATFSQPTQPKPKPICDRSGKPENTEDVFVVKGWNVPFPRDRWKRFARRIWFFRIDRWNLIICLKTSVLSVLTMEQGNLLSNTAQVHTQWKNNLLLKKIVTLRHSTRTKFNRAINEENIDFNIPGLPHSAVKRSHGVKVQNLIQKIENHPQRQALQSDLQQHRQFNPCSKEITRRD